MIKEADFRPSTLQERQEFYDKEFSIKDVKSWFRKNKLPFPQLCSIDVGTETGITHLPELKGSMLYFKFSELKKKIKKYIPEDIYYDRNQYKNPNKILKTFDFNQYLSQELMFDIDADNVKCNCGKGLKVCNSCIKKSYNCTIKMNKELKKYFKKTSLIYSGRGFHIYVLNKKTRFMSPKDRDFLTKKFLNYSIDPWVSKGFIRLARLPYSLNSLVSRKVIPITKEFNKQKTIPLFLNS